MIGWAADLIGIICAYADQLNAVPYGHGAFDFGPSSGMAVVLPGATVRPDTRAPPSLTAERARRRVSKPA